MIVEQEKAFLFAINLQSRLSIQIFFESSNLLGLILLKIIDPVFLSWNNKLQKYELITIWAAIIVWFGFTPHWASLIYIRFLLFIALMGKLMITNRIFM